MHLTYDCKKQLVISIFGKNGTEINTQLNYHNIVDEHFDEPMGALHKVCTAEERIEMLFLS